MTQWLMEFVANGATACSLCFAYVICLAFVERQLITVWTLLLGMMSGPSAFWEFLSIYPWTEHFNSPCKECCVILCSVIYFRSFPMLWGAERGISSLGKLWWLVPVDERSWEAWIDSLLRHRPFCLNTTEEANASLGATEQPLQVLFFDDLFACLMCWRLLALVVALLNFHFIVWSLWDEHLRY